MRNARIANSLWCRGWDEIREQHATKATTHAAWERMHSLLLDAARTRKYKQCITGATLLVVANHHIGCFVLQIHAPFQTALGPSPRVLHCSWRHAFTTRVSYCKFLINEQHSCVPVTMNRGLLQRSGMCYGNSAGLRAKPVSTLSDDIRDIVTKSTQ